VTGTERAAAEGYAGSYVAHHVPGEHARLRTLEAAFDPATFRVLGRLELPADAHCLDLGAGAGSVAAWLAARHPLGQITATDTDTRFLRFPPLTRVRVLQHDAVREDFPPEAFDLVHARALLCHLPQREELLHRAVGWVRPGGWLVIEDLSVRPVDASAHPLFRKVTRAGERLLATTVGSDLRWADTLAARFTELGLAMVESSTAPGTVGDRSATDAFWTATFDQATPALLEQGLLTRQDIENMRALHRSPSFTDTGISLISVSGRKAAPGRVCR
jgi:SAM-dependent methyltransferase